MLKTVLDKIKTIAPEIKKDLLSLPIDRLKLIEESIIDDNKERLLHYIGIWTEYNLSVTKYITATLLNTYRHEFTDRHNN
jgi:hypothetical protein